MKRAFDENVPRVKPRVRFNPAAEAATEATTLSPPESVPIAAPGLPLGDVPVSAAPTAESKLGDMQAAVSSAAAAVLNEVDAGALEARARPEPRQSARSEAPATAKVVAPVGESGDAQDQRRRKLRARLWALQNPPPTLDAASPQAADAVVAAAEGLTRELSEARAQVGRLEHELARARTDLSRAVAEAETERQHSSAQELRIDEARMLLGNLETELSVVEEERDEILAEVRSLREADGARRDSLSALSRELDETRRALNEARAEQAEVVRELETGDAEIARLSLEVKRLEGERTRFLQELTELSSAKGELLDSRRTIERVHQLLAVASAPRRR